MNDFIVYIIVFFTGVLARILSTLAGGGAGLVETPILLMLGVPAKITVASRKFSAIGGHTVGAYQFHKFKKIDWTVAITLSIIGIIAGLIGANILVRINEGLLKEIIAIMLLAALPFTFLKKSFGLKRKIVSKQKMYLGYVINFFIFLMDSTIAIAGGLFSSLTLIFFMGLTYLQVSAIRRITGLTTAIVVSVVFVYHGLVDWMITVFLMLGGMFGSYIGAHIAVKKGSGLVKIVFTILVVVSAVRLLFF